MRLRLMFGLCVLLISISAAAQSDVYDNGPTNGTVDAWTINFGFVVSDTFTLQQSNTVNGLTFVAWLFPGDVLESAEVSITSSEFGGTTFFDGMINFTPSDCTTNQLGFTLCNENGTFNDVRLNAGTYWLNLQNAVVNTGDPVYWDENSGPSSASQNSVGTIPSESFTVLGGSTTTTIYGTPEPEIILYICSGLLGAACVLRRRRFKVGL